MEGTAVADHRLIGRALWLDERRRGIGGTDAAAILGQSRYKTPLDVWLEKRRDPLASEYETTAPARWGLLLEDAIAMAYQEDTGRTLYNPNGLVYHPEHPELIGSPDRVCVGEPRGVELKTAGTFAAKEFGEPGTDEIPMPYVVQCVHYMAITGLDSWDVAVLVGGQDFRIYTVRRDLDLERGMVGRLVEWWKRHVIGGERPELDGTKHTREYLSRLYPRAGENLLGPSSEAEHWAVEFLNARATRRDAEDREEKAANHLRDMIGDAAGMESPGRWKATWRSAKGRTTTDWKRIAEDLAGFLELRGDRTAKEWLDDVVPTHTTQAPSGRRFVLTEVE